MSEYTYSLPEIHCFDNERGKEFQVTTYGVLECSLKRRKKTLGKCTQGFKDMVIGTGGL
jgi:hypothetical protein